ncbi:uncharacterized protein CLUP02_08669 [Colletotrichum lupini]|uniref:Uncharacterized protein n=1 Tax=Colletotrichum lupini TaxID=145971 RepID=A0A9Q8STI6_9PEZI|nr:uncharacterized protein CLUP02_08669 [Colletotrichum lupini]UQC83175.1 hypothetical protein CLUP02_08669 [Colletotrichum lupini]
MSRVGSSGILGKFLRAGWVLRGVVVGVERAGGQKNKTRIRAGAAEEGGQCEKAGAVAKWAVTGRYQGCRAGPLLLSSVALSVTRVVAVLGFFLGQEASEKGTSSLQAENCPATFWCKGQRGGDGLNPGPDTGHCGTRRSMLRGTYTVRLSRFLRLSANQKWLHPQTLRCPPEVSLTLTASPLEIYTAQPPAHCSRPFAQTLSQIVYSPPPTVHDITENTAEPLSGRMVGAHEKRLGRPLLARQMAPDFERLVQPAATADSAAFLVAVGAD